MDSEFLVKISPTFLCLVTAILGLARRYWQAGLFSD